MVLLRFEVHVSEHFQTASCHPGSSRVVWNRHPDGSLFQGGILVAFSVGGLGHCGNNVPLGCLRCSEMARPISRGTGSDQNVGWNRDEGKEPKICEGIKRLHQEASVFRSVLSQQHFSSFFQNEASTRSQGRTQYDTVGSRSSGTRAKPEVVESSKPLGYSRRLALECSKSIQDQDLKNRCEICIVYTWSWIQCHPSHSSLFHAGISCFSLTSLSCIRPPCGLAHRWGVGA